MRLCLFVSLLLLTTTSSCAPTTESDPSNVDSAKKQEIVPAAPGVAKQGQKVRGKQGILITPVNAYFSVRQRIVFDQIPRLLQLYSAEHGQAPKTHEEFMNKIIDANQIRLPDLPEGHEYQFDADKQQLMVKRPTGG